MTLSAGAELKGCCAAIYGSAWATLLLGESFHPGGLALTERLGHHLGLGPETRLLDVAAGRGTSAIHLARIFGCRVTGLDLAPANVERAREAAKAAGVGDRVAFVVGDAEGLPFPDASFDVALCECALCTFPDKQTAVSEIARVLRPRGLVGISDVTRDGDLSDRLAGVLAAAACIADARSVAGYTALFAHAGLGVRSVERHDGVLTAVLDQIRLRLLGAKLLARTNGLDFADLPVRTVQEMVREAADAIRRGCLGYATIVAAKPPNRSGADPSEPMRLPTSDPSPPG